MKKRILFPLVFLSGCSALIYEVVWHRYLSILLGAQARATVIVLAIFLGGIAAGYAYFGRWSRKYPTRVFHAYVLIEALLGFWAAAFPLLFKMAVPLTSVLYTRLGSQNLIVDLSISVLLMGLPTFLMGGTLPLLTQGGSDNLESSSRTHALLYGLNTLGAALGCLLAGYLLIPTFGLRTTVWMGSLGNLLVALVAIFAFRVGQVGYKLPRVSIRKMKWTTSQRLLAVIAFLSGFYLITLQTVFIRLMGLSVGASNYSFTLVVSIFVLALGAGSMFARNISDYRPHHLFWNQMAISALFAILYVSGDYWSYGSHLIRIALRDTPQNFFLYQGLLAAAFGLLLFIPVGVAGLTLPLCFHLIKDKRETLGYRVGQLYALNSVGCVLGAVVGGYALLHFFNLDAIFKICIALMLLSSVCAFLFTIRTEKRARPVWTGAFGALFTLGILFFVPPYHKDRFIQAFRQSQPIPDVSYEGVEKFGRHLARSTEYLLFRDGPNTSVGIGVTKSDGQESSRTIFVNGKSDGNTRGDFFTTLLLAHLPGLLSPYLDRVGVIGFGTGITVGALALYEEVQHIDVAEISGTILQNATYFDEYNGYVSKNPKVKFHEMDALRFFDSSRETFNVIVSEPSNPWVAGIENLYTKEFYALAKRRLDPEGVFVQWLHTYSFNDSLLRTVLKTMSTQFPYISVFQLRGGDCALYGSSRPLGPFDLVRGHQRFNDNQAVLNSLVTAGLGRFESVLALEVIPSTLTPQLAEGAVTHGFENPILSTEAAKAFFTGSSSDSFSFRKLSRNYFSSLKDSLLATYMLRRPLPVDALESLRYSFCEHSMSRHKNLCDETLIALQLVEPKIQYAQEYAHLPIARDLATLSAPAVPAAKKFGRDELQSMFDLFESYKKFASPIAQFPASRLLARIEACIQTISPKESLYGECVLQKLLVLDTLRHPGMDSSGTANAFLTWFQGVPKTAPNYDRLKQANDIVRNLIQMK